MCVNKAKYWKYRWKAVGERDFEKSLIYIATVTCLWHVKFKSQDGDVMRTDNVMMRAADDKMRADDNMAIGHFSQFIWKVNQKFNKVKCESVWTLFRIARLASGKSYLVINCCNSHEKLTISAIRSSWPTVKLGEVGSWFKHCSVSLV